MKKLTTALFLPLLFLMFFGAGILAVFLTPTEVQAGPACSGPPCDNGGVPGCRYEASCPPNAGQQTLSFHDLADIDCTGPFACTVDAGQLPCQCNVS